MPQAFAEPLEAIADVPMGIQEPPLGLRLAMLGFGALTGVVLLILFLYASGLIGRIVS
jgi:hypothetical protein